MEKHTAESSELDGIADIGQEDASYIQGMRTANTYF
jgi:hypothetical protein